MPDVQVHELVVGKVVMDPFVHSAIVEEVLHVHGGA